MESPKGKSANKFFASIKYQLFIILFLLMMSGVAYGADSISDSEYTEQIGLVSGEVGTANIENPVLNESAGETVNKNDVVQVQKPELSDTEDASLEELGEQPCDSSAVLRTSAARMVTPANGIVQEGDESVYYRNGIKQVNMWILDSSNWLYATPTGALSHDEVRMINGSYYGFNDSFIMQIGEFLISGRRYYAESSGAIRTNQWIATNGSWKYANQQGEITCNNWIVSNNKKYYAGEDGKIVQNNWFSIGSDRYYAKAGGDIYQSGWFYLNNEWYYAQQSGAVYRNSWIKSGTSWYYTDSTGAIYQDEWFYDGNAWYYAKKGGAIYQSSWIKVNNLWYYANSGGAIYQNTWFKDGAYWYYAKSNGDIYQSSWLQVGGDWYYAQSGGNIYQSSWFKVNDLWYYANSGGAIYQNAWFQDGNAWYYAKANGDIYQSSWFQVGGAWYYAQSGGNIYQSSWFKVNDLWYYASSGGAIYQNDWFKVGYAWYYAKPNGDIYQSSWFKVGTTWYYAQSGGNIYQSQWFKEGKYWYYATSGGGIYQSTLAWINGSCYCFESGGQMMSGAFNWNGNFYIADRWGVIKKAARGIDVSVYQGQINWAAVAQTDVAFAIMKAAGRYGKSGEIYNDSRFDENMRGAIANGIAAGAYFFTEAITVDEAVEEANYLADRVKGYNVTLPLVIDTESLAGSRHNTLTAQQRTAVVKAFCDTIIKRGYTPMIYGSTSWLNNQLIMSNLSNYKVWVAQYYNRVTYTGKYVCWQNTSSSRVNGISGNVDNNYWYNPI